MKRRSIGLAERVLAALLIAAALMWLFSLFSVWRWSRRDLARPADAIVVLGAAQYEGRPSPVLRARLDHAIELWKDGLAPVLVVTGGKGDGDTTTEAAVGRKYALSKGIPDSSILMENRGRTTSESLRSVAAMLRTRDMSSAVLVSDPFHMFRLSILARRFGIEPFTSPTGSSPISANRSQVWRYVLGESLKAPLEFILQKR